MYMCVNSVHTEKTCGLGLACLLHKHVTHDLTETWGNLILLTRGEVS